MVGTCISRPAAAIAAIRSRPAPDMVETTPIGIVLPVECPDRTSGETWPADALPAKSGPCLDGSRIHLVIEEQCRPIGMPYPISRVHQNSERTGSTAARPPGPLLEWRIRPVIGHHHPHRHGRGRFFHNCPRPPVQWIGSRIFGEVTPSREVRPENSPGIAHEHHRCRGAPRRPRWSILRGIEVKSAKQLKADPFQTCFDCFDARHDTAGPWLPGSIRSPADAVNAPHR